MRALKLRAIGRRVFIACVCGGCCSSVCSFIQKCSILCPGAQLLGIASDYAVIFRWLRLLLLLSFLSILPHMSSMGETRSIFFPRREKPQIPPMKHPFCHLLQENIALPAPWFSLGRHNNEKGKTSNRGSTGTCLQALEEVPEGKYSFFL